MVIVFSFRPYNGITTYLWSNNNATTWLCVARAHNSGNLTVHYFQSNILTMLASFIRYQWETLLKFHRLNSLYRPNSAAVVNVMFIVNLPLNFFLYFNFFNKQLMGDGYRQAAFGWLYSVWQDII